MSGDFCTLGTRTSGTLWKHWLGCATPLILGSLRGLLDWRDAAWQSVGNPAIIVGMAMVGVILSGAISGFFALGFAAGQRVWRLSDSIRGVLADIVVPSAVAFVIVMGFFAAETALGARHPATGLGLLFTAVISCVALGAAAGLAGRLETVFARAAAVEVGFVIGLTAEMSYPEASNLGPPLLAVLAIATSFCTIAGTKLAVTWRRRGSTGGPDAPNAESSRPTK